MLREEESQWCIWRVGPSQKLWVIKVSTGCGPLHKHHRSRRSQCQANWLKQLKDIGGFIWRLCSIDEDVWINICAPFIVSITGLFNSYSPFYRFFCRKKQNKTEIQQLSKNNKPMNSCMDGPFSTNSRCIFGGLCLY